MKTSEKVLTFAAVFISCLALVVSIVQTNVMLKQTHASVWPRLSNGQGVGPDYFQYTVKNEGVGPAVISSIEYNYQDTSFQKLNELIHYFGKLEVAEIQGSVNLNFDYITIYEGSVIGASEAVEVFKANDSTAVRIGKKYLLDTNIRIDYCSIYETCWSMQNDDIIELN